MRCKKLIFERFTLNIGSVYLALIVISQSFFDVFTGVVFTNWLTLSQYYIVFFIDKRMNFSSTPSFEESFLNSFSDIIRPLPLVKGVCLDIFQMFQKGKSFYKGISKGCRYGEACADFYVEDCAENWFLEFTLACNWTCLNDIF